MSSVDAIVIGSGPAGITAALYLARSGCSVMLYEQMAAGGQVLQTAELENYPGFPKGIKGYELADLLSAHLEGLNVTRSSEAVVEVSGHAGAFTVKTSKGSVTGKVVVVCTGAHHRRLGVTGESWMQGKGVSYCALCDGNFFRGQPVAVVGGGNSALEESLYLAKLASKVYVIHRRDAFRGARIYLDKLEAMPDKVEIVRSSTVTALHGDNALEGVTVTNVNTGEERRLDVQGLFIYVGFEPGPAFLPAAVEREGLHRDGCGDAHQCSRHLCRRGRARQTVPSGHHCRRRRRNRRAGGIRLPGTAPCVNQCFARWSWPFRCSRFPVAASSTWSICRRRRIPRRRSSSPATRP